MIEGDPNISNLARINSANHDVANTRADIFI